MKNWFRILFYASLLFLVIALIRADYLRIPTIVKPLRLVLSFLFLFLGFGLNTLAWARAVQEAGHPVPLRAGMASGGLSVFAKYIPGKIWVIMGRAEYLCRHYGLGRNHLGSLSFDAQFVALWTALLLGTIGILNLGGLEIYGLGVLLVFVLLSLVIYTPLAQRVAGGLAGRLFRKNIELPKIPFFRVLHLALYYGLNWMAWCVGFWLMAGSLLESPLPFSAGFSFGLAGSLGILAVFAPGGLGVREGVLIGMLSLAGIGLTEANTVALASRLWFLLGELFVFLLGLALQGRARKGQRAKAERNEPPSRKNRTQLSEGESPDYNGA